MAERAPTELPQLGVRVRFAALLLGGLFGVAVVGYKLIGGADHTWMQAVYMTANVLTTTGFREEIDVASRPGAMLFTVVLMFIGAGAVVYSISVFTAFVIEGDLTQGFRRRRMRRTIKEMTEHYIVCGAGSTGFAVLAELVKTHRPVVVIENQPARVARIEEEFPDVPVIQGDFTDDQILTQAGVARADGVVVCTTIDKDSLVATITARQLNPGIRIVARGANERSMQRLRQAGADGAVSPALIGGMRMASELIRPSVVSFLDMMLRDTNRNLRIEEIVIPQGSPVVGMTLGGLDAHHNTNCLLLAIKDPSTGEYTYNPSDASPITAGMVLIVMGDPAGVRALCTACGATMARGPTPVRGVATVA